MGVHYHLGKFPPAQLDWQRLIPLLGPASAAVACYDGILAAILSLYERMKREVADLTRSHYAIHALDWIFERPIFKGSNFAASAGIPEPTAKRIVSALRNAGILRVLVEASGRRAATLCFPALLNIAEGWEAY